MRLPTPFRRLIACGCALLGSAIAHAGAPVPDAAGGDTSGPHNVVLFVPDGLRAALVDADSAPAMTDVVREGVMFANPHSMFPTFTTPNASAMATGHYLGDTGDFANTLYAGYLVNLVPGQSATSLTPFIESDPILGDIDAHFAGDFLDETTLLKAARAKGFGTAAIGKLGPALIFDHTERTGLETIVLDDQTGHRDTSSRAGLTGIPLSPAVFAALSDAGIAPVAPDRGANKESGSATAKGTLAANFDQQSWFMDATVKVVLPMLKARGKPFLLVYWSRDPDGTQHNQGDSLNALTPGINGPTSRAAVHNADDNLARLRAAIKDQGLEASTDIIVAADHGFSTISKQSRSSPAAAGDYSDVPRGFLPPGFLAMDLARALGLKLHDPDAGGALVPSLELNHPRRGNGLLGDDPEQPDVIVAANGGSDLIYLPKTDTEKNKALAQKIVTALLAHDTVSGIFVDGRLGTPAGTLPLSIINLQGSAVTPMPAIVVSFRSFSTGCDKPVLCAVEVADTTLQQGQGMHGSFSRADTMNFMAATGPDFKIGFKDPTPVSNADVGQTIARLMGLDIAGHGRLVGRVVTEALIGHDGIAFTHERHVSEPAEGGLQTVLEVQTVGDIRYFDAAGFAGRTVGLEGVPPWRLGLPSMPSHHPRSGCRRSGCGPSRHGRTDGP